MATPTVQPGDLRHRIVVQAPATAQDAFGQPTGGFTDLMTVWAAITAVTGRDIYALGSGFTSQVTHKVIIRYPGRLLPSNTRVLYDGRVFLVQAVSDPDERKRWLNLMCLEQNA